MAKVEDKKRLLKAAREKQLVAQKGAPLRLSADYSVETQARMEREEMLPVMKTKTCDQDYSTQQDSHLKWKVK